MNADELVVRIEAVPTTPSDGPALADEILAAISSLTADSPAENGAAARASGTSRPAEDEPTAAMPRAAKQPGEPGRDPSDP
jgi:hypothetical protein